MKHFRGFFPILSWGSLCLYQRTAVKPQKHSRHIQHRHLLCLSEPGRNQWNPGVHLVTHSLGGFWAPSLQKTGETLGNRMPSGERLGDDSWTRGKYHTAVREAKVRCFHSLLLTNSWWVSQNVKISRWNFASEISELITQQGTFSASCVGISALGLQLVLLGHMAKTPLYNVWKT